MTVFVPAGIIFVAWAIASLSLEWRIDALRNRNEANKRQRPTAPPAVFDSSSWTGSTP